MRGSILVLAMVIGCWGAATAASVEQEVTNNRNTRRPSRSTRELEPLGYRPVGKMTKQRFDVTDGGSWMRGVGRRSPKAFNVPGYMGAYGFGKRNNGPLSKQEDTLLISGPGQMESLPVDWFVLELMGDRDLAESVVRRFVDRNKDGAISSSELLNNAY